VRGTSRESFRKTSDVACVDLGVLEFDGGPIGRQQIPLAYEAASNIFRDDDAPLSATVR
jgi:hypothetical protein